MTLDLPTFPMWPQLADDVIERSIHWYLRHILTIVAWPNGPADSKLAVRDLPLTNQRTEERRLPAAVRTDEADDVAALDCGGEARDQGPPLDTERDIARNRD